MSMDMKEVKDRVVGVMGNAKEVSVGEAEMGEGLYNALCHARVRLELAMKLGVRVRFPEGVGEKVVLMLW